MSDEQTIRMRPKQGGHQVKMDRNIALYRDYLRGIKVTELAIRYNINLSRVYALIAWSSNRVYENDTREGAI